MATDRTRSILTVANIRRAIRETQLAGVEWIEVGVREDAAGASTWNARHWPTWSDLGFFSLEAGGEPGDWAVDLYDFEALRDVLQVLRDGYPFHNDPVELDLYCYKRNGRGRFAETELLGNVELRVDAAGVVELASADRDPVVLRG
jgi:hypothetical protein